MLNKIVSGAASQFGREFGRAGANRILKGANSYTINNKSHKSSQSSNNQTYFSKAIAGINKIKLASTDKTNVIRLITLTNETNRYIEFKGDFSLERLKEFEKFVSTFLIKFQEINSMVTEGYETSQVNTLRKSVDVFNTKVEKFNEDMSIHINENIKKEEAKYLSKKTSLLLAIPLIGLEKIYLKKYKRFFINLALFLLWVGPILNLIDLFIILFQNKSKFDNKYNYSYLYYKNMQEYNIRLNEKLKA